MNFNDRVYEACKKIPKGKISTYKLLAEYLDCKAYRVVGQALKKNPYAPIVACHRIVNSNGNIGGFCGETKGKKIKDKINLLEKEGVFVENNKIVDFEKKLFRF